MKSISRLILGMVFVFGMIPMSNAEVVETAKPEAVEKKVPCVYVFDVCDTVFPEDYGLFDACLQANGC